MLIRFGVKNHKSFRDKQEFSLVAASDDSMPENIAEVENLHPSRVLRSAAIYGANASGKTSVLDALRHLARIVRDSHTDLKAGDRIPASPFALDPDSPKGPTEFSIDFTMEGVRSNFGVTICGNEVLEEWLYTFPHRRSQLVYHRTGPSSEHFKFGPSLKGENKTTARLTRPNSLFISAAAQNNHEGILPFYDWFRTNIDFIGESNIKDHERGAHSRLVNDSTFKKNAMSLLKEADTGVVDVEAEEKPLELEAFKDFFHPDVLEQLKDSKQAKVALLHRSAHASGVAKLKYFQESQGTRRLLALCGSIFDALDRGKIVLIDELEASMHPLITRSIIKLFHSARNKSNAQLIFSTHNDGLLDGGIFRRDQIWFTEKDTDGASHLYPLTDYKPRKKENLAKGYLLGRYGAIPFQGALEF